jgi:hypothetical protein
MDLSSYNGLKDAVGVLVGGSSDSRFGDALDVAILAAESELNYGIPDPATDIVVPGLRVPEMVSRSLLAVDRQYEVLPPDCLAVLACAEVVGDREFPMPQVPIDGAGEYDAAGRGRSDGLRRGRRSSWFALTGRQIRFGPSSGLPGVVRVTYYAKVPALASATPCYDVLSTYPLVYLYGTARHVALYNVDDEATQKWTAAFAGAIRAANRSARNR